MSSNNEIPTYADVMANIEAMQKASGTPEVRVVDDEGNQEESRPAPQRNASKSVDTEDDAAVLEKQMTANDAIQQVINEEEGGEPNLNEPNFKALDKLEKLVDEPTKSEEVEKPEESQQVMELKDYIEKLENTKVMHKIDGEMVEVDLKEALKELTNTYSGHKAVDKRFTELDKEKKLVYNQIQAQEAVIQNFNKFREAGDIVGGYTYIGSLTGTPGYMIKEQLIAALAPEIERRYGLTDEQIRLDYLQQENEYLAQQREAELRSQKEAQTQAERELAVTKLRETQGIDEKTWEEAFKQLDVELAPGLPITPEMVAEKAKSKLNESKTLDLVNTVSSKYKLHPAETKALEEILKKDPSWTAKELEELVQKSLEDLSKQETEKKLASKLQKTKSVSQGQPQQSVELAAQDLKRAAGIKMPWE